MEQLRDKDGRSGMLGYHQYIYLLEKVAENEYGLWAEAAPVSFRRILWYYYVRYLYVV